MASYKIVFKPTAWKQLAAVDHRVDRQRIVKCIQQLADNPRPHGCQKLSGTKNTYRIRQGDNRIVYDIDDDRIVVLILKVRHRKDVYRRRGRA
ncbi:MAG TPA: type II toxin-antitoxin system RelE/ParE family toxin [Thermoanaerobaculia bacterium]|nr:type II toxin-antitoxin system RelE/ParE family toxin [Thermoanaerobaculia bacterium]